MKKRARHSRIALTGDKEETEAVLRFLVMIKGKRRKTYVSKGRQRDTCLYMVSECMKQRTCTEKITQKSKK